ncbi:MAG: hypothetical protein H0W88_10325 [Parachlamydiaceae bacterium]|nr:hypothetical protein [Parachlamydiaceae bacterium]
MNDPRQLHGDHTWKIVIDYESCPKCGNIIENRQPYEQRFGLYQKDLICERCKNVFTVSKKREPIFEKQTEV